MKTLLICFLVKICVGTPKQTQNEVTSLVKGNQDMVYLLVLIIWFEDFLTADVNYKLICMKTDTVHF